MKPYCYRLLQGKAQDVRESKRKDLQLHCQHIDVAVVRSSACKLGLEPPKKTVFLIAQKRLRLENDRPAGQELPVCECSIEQVHQTAHSQYQPQ
eukprot:6189667-Pleurochrysis_carterae.AAC.2